LLVCSEGGQTLPQESESTTSFVARAFNSTAMVLSGLITYDALMFGLACTRVGEIVPTTIAFLGLAAQAGILRYNFRHYWYGVKNHKEILQEPKDKAKRRLYMAMARTALPILTFYVASNLAVATLSDEVKQKAAPPNNPGPAVSTPG
jgi:hypothetical protein